MKSDYQLIIDCCEAEIVTATKDWVLITDRGEYYHIIFRPLGTSVDIFKPKRAAEQDRAYKTIYGEDTALYTQEALWHGVAQMMGLKSDFIPVTERLPKQTGDYLALLGGEHVKLNFDLEGWRNRRNVWRSGSIIVYPTHWQPLPPMP